MTKRNLSLPLPIARCVISFIAITLAACGGGGGGGDAEVERPPPADVITTYDLMLDAASVVAGSTETATATGTVRYNSTDDEIDVTVTLSGITATSVSLRRAYAGDRGDEVYALSQAATADQWTLSPRSFTAADAGDLLVGSLYLFVTTDANPDGALRGQIVPGGVEVVRIELSAGDVTSGSDSSADGTAWLTVDRNANTLTAHVELRGLPEADAGSLYRAFAGMDGPVVASLESDADSASHWLLATSAASADLLAALASAEIYVQVSTPTLPTGALRGQYLPAGAELVRTDVRDDAVVANPSPGPFEGSVGRLMTTIVDDALTSVLNLSGIADSTRAELRRAPAGQNGPAIASFEPDMNDSRRWILSDLPVDAAIEANLDNRTLYVSVSTPSAPDSAARGQIETAESAEPADTSAFLVTMVDPPNAEQLDSLPAGVFVTLNREPLAESATPKAVSIESSGQDGSFDDGNETSIVPSSVSANGNTVEISLAGVQASDDVYRVTLTGGGASGIVDLSGIALDGDNDGVPGGRYETAFEVEQPPVMATLTRIQAEIFTPSCATAGCHSGNGPPDGLLLTAGNAWSNIVNVDAVQINLKRIEPGDPSNSYLVRKVEGRNIAANRMPLGAPPLSQAEIDLIREWVLAGALDN